MPFLETGFPGLKIFEPRVFSDARGYFFESYNRDTFFAEGIAQDWVQDNESSSCYGVVRGLHYQNNPYAQAKLVRVIRGHILDVAVDLRKGSPTYLKVYSVELTDANKRQLLVPRGFAHGFSVLSAEAIVLYKCDNLYNRESEGSIIYNDPVLNIDWMIPADQVILSEKDRLHPTLDQANFDFTF